MMNNSSNLVASIAVVLGLCVISAQCSLNIRDDTQIFNAANVDNVVAHKYVALGDAFYKKSYSDANCDEKNILAQVKSSHSFDECLLYDNGSFMILPDSSGFEGEREKGRVYARAFEGSDDCGKTQKAKSVKTVFMKDLIGHTISFARVNSCGNDKDIFFVNDMGLH
eukprot:Nk52_evm27s2273 gene=Nk52_evmTU27s2273